MGRLGDLARQCAFLTLIESCWLFAVAATLGSITDSGAPPAWPLLAAAVYVNLCFNLLPEPEGGSVPLLLGRLGAVALGMALLGALPVRATFLLFALYLAWRARSLAELDLAEERYRAAVFAGALGCALALLARALAPLPPGLGLAQGWAVAVFALAGLLGLALAQRLHLIAEEDLTASGGKSWLIAGGAISVGVVATALLVLFVPGAASAGLLLLGLLGHGLATLLYYLLLPLAYLVFALLVPALQALLLRAHLHPTQAQPQGINYLEQLRRQQQATSAALGHWLGALEWVLIGLAALLVLLIVSAAIRRRADPTRRASDTRSSVWRWPSVGDWLGGLLRHARQLAVTPAEALPLRARRPNPPRSAREMFVDVQARAGRLGWAALPQQTALEYCTTLSAKMPAVASALERLAIGYGDERYGAAPPAETVPRLLPDWQRIVAESEARAHDGT